MLELTIQLAIIFVGKQLIGNIQEVGKCMHFDITARVIPTRLVGFIEIHLINSDSSGSRAFLLQFVVEVRKRRRLTSKPSRGLLRFDWLFVCLHPSIVVIQSRLSLQYTTLEEFPPLGMFDEYLEMVMQVPIVTPCIHAWKVFVAFTYFQQKSRIQCAFV
jgi:hypothetical protein